MLWYILYIVLCLLYVHAVILVVLKNLFILVCRSKSPTGLMLHVVQHSTRNDNCMSMSILPSSRFGIKQVWCIASIFFGVGIPNLVYGRIFGWPSVAYHFWVTVNLTSELVFRIIMFGAFFLYYLTLESQIWCVVASCDGIVLCITFVTLT